jgi:hypothetical protein
MLVVVKFVVTLFMNIAMNDAQKTWGLDPRKSFTILSLIFCKAIIPNPFMQKFYISFIKSSGKKYIPLL